MNVENAEKVIRSDSQISFGNGGTGIWIVFLVGSGNVWIKQMDTIKLISQSNPKYHVTMSFTCTR